MRFQGDQIGAGKGRFAQNRGRRLLGDVHARLDLGAVRAQIFGNALEIRFGFQAFLLINVRQGDSVRRRLGRGGCSGGASAMG